MIRVTAILVSHDGATWLPQTVAALASQSHPIDRIVAVDTGSTDDSVRLLRSAGIHVIPTTRGVGFGEAVQLAVDATPAFVATEPKGKSASSASPSTLPAVHEWLWIVHDDCAPAKDALERLLAGVKEKPQVALAGPKLRGWHDRKHLLELGVSIATNGARWTGLEYREQDQGQHDDERDVLAVSTAAMLIRREVFTELGGFDPKLSLFRDDVDLGWRVRAAGHSVIAVPEAIAYHGEAASNERRSIDVDDALLHRPLLLDRRHAAYVLLANASLIYLPILALQLLLSALVRSIGYLIAKRPGYALDELAAVALVLIKPQEIFAARKVRRGQRLLSGSAIRSFLPPRGIQLRLALERARNALERYLARRIPFQILPNEPERSVLDSDDEKLEEEEIFTERKSTLRTLFTRPLFLFSLAVLVLTLIASRNRLGAIEGGALLQSPSSGMDLISKYFESWHPIALGSSANTPTWVALVGLASGLLLGNLKLLIALFFYAAIPLTLWIGYRFAKGFTTSTLIALAAASAYAFSPPILHAATHGLIGTLVIALITPLLIKSMMGASAIESLSWRAVAAHALLYSIALAFSPPAFIILATWHFLLSMMQTLGEFGRRLRGDREDLQLVIARIVKRSLILVGAIAINVPWSLELLAHPSRALLEPGVSLDGANGLLLLFGNPGLSLATLSAAPIIMIIALFRRDCRPFALIALFISSITALLSLFSIAGHGSSQLISPSLGGATTLFIAASIIAGIRLLELVLPQIRDSALNFRHFAAAAIAISVLLTSLSSIIWWLGPGAGGPVKSEETFAVPAFITANATTQERYKSLLIREREGRLLYWVVRDKPLEIGDSDIVYGSSEPIEDAVAGLVTGAGIESSSILGDYGIRYLFLTQPVNKSLARTIDGIGGFTRASSTDAGVVWKVVGASSRVSLLPDVVGDAATELSISLGSDEVAAEGTITRPGIVTIAERFDDRWRMLVNNNRVELTRGVSGLPQFEITEEFLVDGGDFIIYHDGTSRRGWLSLQFIALATFAILALPSRRRRSDVPIEELS